MNFMPAIFQAMEIATGNGARPILPLSAVFMFFFVTMGPPLKTPMVYFARTQHLDPAVRRSLALKTFLLATIAVLIGGFLGSALRGNWHISLPAMLLAGGIIFFLVSLRSVLDQYEPGASVTAAPAPGETPRVPGAFETAVPMIVTPYGLAGVIIILAASPDPQRTIGVVAMLLLVMVLHLLAMLFAGPVVRTIGPLPFKLFGTVIGSLTVGLSIQMMIAALIGVGLLQGVSILG